MHAGWVETRNLIKNFDSHLRIRHFEVFPYAVAMFYTYALRDGRAHVRDDLYPIRIVWLCILDSIGSSGTTWLILKKKTQVTKVGGVYCEGDAGCFFCLVYCSLSLSPKKKKKKKKKRWADLRNK